MDSTFMIEQAYIDEVDEIAVLFDMYRSFYQQKSDIEGAKNFLKERFMYSESVIFVAKDLDLNRYIGFTQLYPAFSSVSMQRSWILNDLFVHEEYRGAGVGKALLDKAKNYAIQTGSKGLSLSTAIDNLNAQRLYEQEGYEREISFYHYYRKV